MNRAVIQNSGRKSGIVRYQSEKDQLPPVLHLEERVGLVFYPIGKSSGFSYEIKPSRNRQVIREAQKLVRIAEKTAMRLSSECDNMSIVEEVLL